MSQLGHEDNLKNMVSFQNHKWFSMGGRQYPVFIPLLIHERVSLCLESCILEVYS